MGKSILITRPEHDITTHYISKWSEKIIDEAKNKGCDVIDLYREKANREKFIGTLQKSSPRMVVLNGHGNEDVVSGHDNKPILQKLDKIVKDKIIYARSCKSAKKLGADSIASGASAYLGYNEDFIFMFDETKITHPLEDKTAVLFLEPSNHIPISLLKGHGVEDANQRSKKLFIKNIEKLLVAGSASDNYYAIRYLFWDMKHQVCLGDTTASF